QACGEHAGRTGKAGAKLDHVSRASDASAQHERSEDRDPRGYRAKIMKSVPAPVSPLMPRSEMISEAPAVIISEMRSRASGGMTTRSSACAAVDAGPDGTTCSCFAPFADLRGGADADAAGNEATFQRTLLSSLTASAVNTWVPSGRSGCSNVTGILNNGSKPLRTNSLPSLRLMKTEMG